jgi:hypothetical protein
MWEQLEAQQAAQGEHPLKGRSNRELVKLEVNPDDNAPGGAEAVDQSSAMRSQINLFWGNVLFEHSQVEVRLTRKNAIVRMIMVMCTLPRHQQKWVVTS